MNDTAIVQFLTKRCRYSIWCLQSKSRYKWYALMTTYHDTNFYSKPTDGEISVELETRLLISWHNKWLIWGVLSVGPSIRKQKPKQSFGCLWTWVPQKHQTKFWDLQKKGSREEQLLHLTSFGVCLFWSYLGVFCIFIMAHSVFSLRHEVENYVIVVHKQGSFLTSSYPINNAEQVSMERSREFRVRHYPVSPSFYGQGGRRPH